MRDAKQKDKTGCGIACVAWLAQHYSNKVTYQQVKEYIFPDPDEYEGLLYTDKADLIRALKKFGVPVTSDRMVTAPRGWGSVRRTAIVKVPLRGRDSADDEWHWMVYDATLQKVYDPQRSYLLKKSSRRVVSYLPIGD